MADKSDQTMDPQQGYASIYGASSGLAKNALVAGVAQFGTDFITSVRGFDGILQLLIENSPNPQTFHSAEGNEQNPRHFSFDGEAPIGCAYAAGIGATAELLTGTSGVIRDVARVEQRHVFGSDTSFDGLLTGQQAFLDHATNHLRARFAVDRALYRQYKEQFGNRLGIMILAGSHTSAKTSGVISNFSLTEAGNPTRAHERQLDFYRLDIALATDMVLRALHIPLLRLNASYALSPELLMRAFQLDSTPVRAVLAAGDRDPELNGKLDPLHLKMGVRGNPFEALQTLRERYPNIAR